MDNKRINAESFNEYYDALDDAINTILEHSTENIPNKKGMLDAANNVSYLLEIRQVLKTIDPKG